MLKSYTLTFSLTQKGEKGKKNLAHEISAKYLESPEVEEGLKLNALKEVSVGYVKEGARISVANDRSGKTVALGSNLTFRWVSDDFPFDISGETTTASGGTTIRLDKPITVEWNNPAAAAQFGASISTIGSYPETMTGGVTVYVGVAGQDSHSAPLFIYADSDVTISGIDIEKGLWFLDITAPTDLAILSLTQGDPDTIHKIDAKYLGIPPVINGEGTTGLENFSKIAVGGLKGLDFTYIEGNPYEVIESPYAKLIKIAEFADINLENENEELTHPISYKYFVSGNGTEQEVSGEFDKVNFENGVYHIYDNGSSDGISLHANQSEVSEIGITLSSGVWSMFAPEGEEQLIPLKISQAEVVKIPANYIDGAGYDATFVLGPGRAGIEVRSYNFDFDSLADKLNAEEPLNIRVDFAVDDSISLGYSPLVVTRIGIINLDTYAIDIYVDSSNNSLKEQYYQDFPGYIEIFSNSSVSWIASPEDISIKFSVAGSGSYNMIASGTYNKLYDLVRTGQMPSVKAHITAQKEQMN